MGNSENRQKSRAKTKRTVIILICAIIAAFFTADTVRTKILGQPPLFCIKAATYGDGISAVYYGAGYKIKRDYDINEETDEYYITLWFLPDIISLQHIMYDYERKGLYYEQKTCGSYYYGRLRY